MLNSTTTFTKKENCTNSQCLKHNDKKSIMSDS